jgi:hypothetical protein
LHRVIMDGSRRPNSIFEYPQLSFADFIKSYRVGGFMSKDNVREMMLGAAGVSLVCILMLLWPLLGRPPYGFFTILKLSVALGSGYAAYSLWNMSQKFAPLCLLLVGSGALHLFAKMRRPDWFPFNLAAILLFALSTSIILFTCAAGNNRVRNER